MSNPKKWIGLGALLVLVVISGVLGGQLSGLIPEVREEMQRTPTPSPVYGNVMAVTPDPSLPTQPPVLRSGSSGPEVVRLQTRLQELGYNPGPADGSFGPGTEQALIAFQQINGLEADGVAGAATYTVL